MQAGSPLNSVLAPGESIIRPAVVLMIGRGLGFAASFIVPVVLVRVFDQHTFGTYKQLFVVYATLYGIAQLGIAESLFYFLPRAGARAGRYVMNAVLVLGLAGGASLLWLVYAAPSVAGWLNNPELPAYLPYIGCFLLLMLMATVLEIVMTAHHRNLHASFSYALSDVLRAALCLVPVLMWGGMQALLLGAIVFAALRVVTTLLYLRHAFATVTGDALAPDAALTRRQLVYAGPFAVAVAIDVLQSNLHLYVVAHYFDAARFAIYAVGCLQVPLVDFLMSSTCNVMMVRMREAIHDGRTAAVLAIWRDTTRKLALIFVPLLGGLLVVADELIVWLFTESYRDSVSIFVLWTATIPFAAFLTDGVLRVYAETRFMILLYLGKLLLVLVTINALLALFGLPGAALAVLLATLVAKAIALRRLATVMRQPLSTLFAWHELAAIFAIGAAAAVPALAIKAAWMGRGLTAILLVGTVYVAAYLALLWHWGPLRREERQTLMATFGRTAKT